MVRVWLTIFMISCWMDEQGLNVLFGKIRQYSSSVYPKDDGLHVGASGDK
jgi:hypothetical protein